MPFLRAHNLLAVAEMPRFLSTRAEHRLVRGLCALPPRLQRLLLGAPPEIDGQRLAPDIHMLMRLADLTGERFRASTPERARLNLRRTTEVVGGPPRAVARVEALRIPGPECELPARLYMPRVGEKPGPLLIYFHGGGWVIGDLDTHDSACRFFAADAGVPVLSVEYRLAPEHPFPAPVDDAEAAFRWAVENAALLGADPGRIAVGGDSAGANMAAVVCCAARDAGERQPAMQLLLYPATDGTERRPSRHLFADGYNLTAADIDWFEARYVPEKDLLHDPRMSVLLTEDLRGLPAAFVATAGFDPLRDEGEEYAERLRGAGVRVALRRYSDLTHSFANMTGVSRSARAAMLEVCGALRMELAVESAAIGLPAEV